MGQASSQAAADSGATAEEAGEAGEEAAATAATADMVALGATEAQEEKVEVQRDTSPGLRTRDRRDSTGCQQTLPGATRSLCEGP